MAAISVPEVWARAVRSGAVWVGIETGAAALLSVLSAFVVARLVGGAEVGTGAAAVALHVLLSVPVNALFADAIVQMRRLPGWLAATAFWSAGMAGLLACGLEYAGGVWLAAGFGDARLVPMSALLAATLPLVGCGGAVGGILLRGGQYRVLAGRTLIGQGCGTAVGIALAWGGAGAWALAGQQAATSLGGALALLGRAGYRPRPVWRSAGLVRLLRVGAPLAASTFVQQSRYRLFAMLLGAVSGAAVLGQVHMAFRLVDTVRELLASALWRLAFPAMARRQHDLAALRAHLDRTLALSALVVFPLIAALALAIRPVVGLLLGPAWSGAADASGPLLLLMGYVFLAFPGGVAATARGRPGIALRANLASLGLTLAGVAALRPETAREAAWIWAAAQFVAAPYVLAATARTLRMAPGRQWRAGLAPLAMAAASGAMAACVAPGWGAGPDAVARCLLAAGLYGGAALLFLRGTLADAGAALLSGQAGRP